MKKRYQPIVAALIAIIVSIVPVGCKQKDAPPAAEALTSPIWSGGVDVDWYDSSKSEFTLTTAEQLAGLAALVNDSTSFMGKIVKLGRNIMLNDTANWHSWANNPPANTWTPIGCADGYKNGVPFKGTFDGGGFAVYGVYINRPNRDHQGLLGFVCNGTTIKNVGVAASYINGGSETGGLVGMYATHDCCRLIEKEDTGTINNCYSNAFVAGRKNVGGLVGKAYSVRIANSYSTVSVIGGMNVGGLVGGSMGRRIINCYSAASVTGGKNVGGLAGSSAQGFILNSYSTGSVTGQENAGGLAGGLENFDSKGDLRGGEINNSYSIGAVTGKTGVGGLAGYNHKSVINSSYSAMTVTGKSYTGGLVGRGDKPNRITSSYYDTQAGGRSIGGGGGYGGRTAVQMKRQATFVGWDFDEVWGIDGEINGGYPYLRGNMWR